MKKFLNYFIKAIDTLVVKLAGWKHIPGSEDKILYLNPFLYKGSPLTLKDGTQISKNDMVAELHIDNTNILNLDVSYTNMIKALHKEMGALKNALCREPFNQIKAIYGITVLYAFAERQGFTAIRINNPLKRFFGSLWENILRIVLKKGRSGRKKKFVEAKQCWLSINQIENMGKKS